MRQNYAVGFAFNAEASKVVLIRKTRPAWQAGKLNGLGGKVDPGETPEHTMAREFFEECGVQTDPAEWHPFAKLASLDGDVICYRLFDDKVMQARSCEDQEIVIVDTDMNLLAQQGMSSVVWLVGIALDTSQPHFFVEAQYNQEFKTGKMGTTTNG